MAQTAKKQSGRPAQTMGVQSGNEIAATAAKQINYHVMGYYPITPSTEVAETLDAMKAEGEHTIRMIPGDHSDIMLAMNTGWITLMAADAQAVYDMNVMAPKIGEEMSVRLPVFVAYDGFFTSHQKRRVEIFADDQVVRDFLGPFVPTVSSVDPKTPVTIGPYMNDPHQINNKKQQADAIVRSYGVIKRVFAEYEALSGRRYDLVEGDRMAASDGGLFTLN